MEGVNIGWIYWEDVQSMDDEDRKDDDDDDDGDDDDDDGVFLKNY